MTGPAAVNDILPVTPAIAARLEAYVELVRKWQPVKNLVAPSTLPDIWRRHVADSAQALAAAPEARRWLDLGSGAGFPGLVTAAFLADVEGARVTLVESNGRKAAFLHTVIRELRLPADVLNVRIETVATEQSGRIGSLDAVSARALAPLVRLLDYSAPFLGAGAVGVFHKGQDFVSEMQEATQSWAFDLVNRQSQIEADSCIAVISHLRRRVPADQETGRSHGTAS